MTALATKRGVRVECTVCGRTKQPIGRSAPMGSYMCDWECAGYRQEPCVGSLWPGETDADFGYPCGDVGTEPWAHYGPEHVAIDCVRWDEDRATVELTDGTELSLYMLETARGEYRLDPECMTPGLELYTWRTAEPWVRAHADELMESYAAHCLDEREEHAINDFDCRQVDYWSRG